MDKGENQAHINGKYLIIVAIIALIGTLATVYKDQLNDRETDKSKSSNPIAKSAEVRPSQRLEHGKPEDIKSDKTIETIHQPDKEKAIKIFELTIITNSNDKISINGKPAIFISGSSSSNVKRVRIFEGEQYEIIIGNCDPIIITKVLKNETITRCS